MAERKLITLENLTTFADELKAKYALQSSVDAVLGKATDAATANTVYGAKAAAAAAKSEAEAKVASVTAGNDGVKVAGTATAPTVELQLSPEADNELAIHTAEGKKGLYFKAAAQAEYSVVKDENSGDYAAIYHLTKGGVNTGVAINIPKDQFVKAGRVETKSEAGAWGAAGTYLVIELQNTDDVLYVNVSDLIEYVTSGSQTGDMVFITVDPTTHKVTATITDGTITLAKLHTDLQTKIGYIGDKAVSAQIDDKITALNLDTTYVKNSDITAVTENEIKALLA